MYFDKNKYNNEISDDIKNMKLYIEYTRLHKQLFHNSCDIKPIDGVDGWTKYITKNFQNAEIDFDCSNYLILP